ncbi:hypothetical protein BGX26_010081 [Mortierella sp. AD094]|nr:hypothetical protein BGX26_010081 [Mortierella sp. AD094]
MPNFNTPSTFHVVNPSNPKILIVGAGLGGLTLAILLEKASIDYEIYERSTSLKTLGSAISLSPNVLPLLEQLGLLDDLKEIWKKVRNAVLYNESGDADCLECLTISDFTEVEGLSGYPSVVMSRPDLHALLLSHVPTHKIHLGKRVLSISQDDQGGVIIRTSDGMTHEGDILVGCDGAHSSVRQSLYKLIASKGSLPNSDTEDLKVSHMSLHGTTRSMDPNIVPYSEDGYGRCTAVIGHKKPQTWRSFEVPGNRFCWRVDVQLQSKASMQSEAFRSTDWGTQSCASTESDWWAFKVPLGQTGTCITIGDLISSTDNENVTKVLLEEKLYTTWYHRRTVLIGDACHKMPPSAGRGAVNAMLDAVILANAFYEIADNATAANIRSAFSDYYTERYALAKSDFQASQRAAKLLAGQTWTDDLMRKAVFNFMPSSLLRMLYVKSLSYRPQASFLPKIEYRGTGRVDSQKESNRYKREKSFSE